MRIKRFKELLEDVGEKYAERRFNIPPRFTEFDKMFRRQHNTSGQEIVYKDKRGVVILKNPKSLDNIGPNVRGVIDNKGNFFTEQESLMIHNPMLTILSNIGVVKYVNAWHSILPTEFITVQREGDGNIKLGESNIWYSNNLPDSIEIFQKFLDKAKIKNPNIKFINKRIQDAPYVKPLPPAK